MYFEHNKTIGQELTEELIGEVKSLKAYLEEEYISVTPGIKSWKYMEIVNYTMISKNDYVQRIEIFESSDKREIVHDSSIISVLNHYGRSSWEVIDVRSELINNENNGSLNTKETYTLKRDY